MNQISVVASETHEKAVAYFKVAEQYGYKFIMEVREIREKQYYKALGFDSFDAYCEKAWNTVRRSMDERIQIAETFGSEWNFESTYSQLGHSKSLLLARLEPERREQLMTEPQQLSNGEMKSIDEMTVRQLKQLEKERKEAEERAEQLEFENQELEQKLKNAFTDDQKEEFRAAIIDQYQVEIAPQFAEQELKIKQLEAKYNKQIQIQSDLVDKYNRQIEELQNSKKMTPEVQKKLKDLEDQLMKAKNDADLLRQDAAKLQSLNNENVQLARANQDLQHKLNESKTIKTSVRILKEHLTDLIKTLSAHHEAAMYELNVAQGNREAMQVVDSFAQQLDELVQKIFNDIKKMTQVKIIDMNNNVEGVIDHA